MAVGNQAGGMPAVVDQVDGILVGAQRQWGVSTDGALPPEAARQDDRRQDRRRDDRRQDDRRQERAMWRDDFVKSLPLRPRALFLVVC